MKDPQLKFAAHRTLRRDDDAMERIAPASYRLLEGARRRLDRRETGVCPEMGGEYGLRIGRGQGILAFDDEAFYIENGRTGRRAILRPITRSQPAALERHPWGGIR